MELMAQPENQAAVQMLIDTVIENTEAEMQMPDQIAASILQNILRNDEGNLPRIKSEAKNKATVFVVWMRAVAAAIFFLAVASFWIFYRKGDDPKTTVAQVVEKHSPALPVIKGTVLTISDGSTIILDSVQNGMLQRGNIKVNKQRNLLIFNAPSLINSGTPVVYNTLSTPRGGRYQVVLPDGSKVWLNAASSLHFPNVFTGSTREVELTGEAYFEVAKNKEKPFQVKVGDMRISVLGTHFNVNAYEDENAIKTSLLEGSVKISRGGASNLLKPGQQAILNKKEHKLKISSAHIDEVIAWKDGLFQFDGSDLSTIMREISRWYNVEVVYAGKIPVRRFEGKISRDAQLSEVLKILRLSNVEFTVEEGKIIVQ